MLLTDWLLVVQNCCQMCSMGILSSLEDQPINNLDEMLVFIKEALAGRWPGWDASQAPVPLADEKGIFINQAKATELQSKLKFHVMHNEAAIFPFFDPFLQSESAFFVYRRPQDQSIRAFIQSYSANKQREPRRSAVLFSKCCKPHLANWQKMW